MKTICAITGTRAEYGLLKPVLERIKLDKELRLILYVTGAHLSPEFGMTYHEIEKDGFTIDRRIDMLLSVDTPQGILKSMGIELIGLADAFILDKPDMLLILGDRYEMLMAASAALLCNIPIAHMCGGETTQGAIDEAVRHSITKMSHLHFAATEEYEKRIIQLGEQPDTVFNVGAPGIENIKRMKLLEKEELEEELNICFKKHTAIVTFHPVTLDEGGSEHQMEELLKALEKLKNLNIIFTKGNADTGGRIMNQMVERFASENKERCRLFDSLGQLRYLSALKYSDIVIGNSSSGIIEVPSFHIPTVNIGIRQQGRIQAGTVINCEPVRDEIVKAVRCGLNSEYAGKIKNMRNPYEGKNTSLTVVEEIKKRLENKINLCKKFYDVI